MSKTIELSLGANKQSSTLMCERTVQRTGIVVRTQGGHFHHYLYYKYKIISLCVVKILTYDVLLRCSPGDPAVFEQVGFTSAFDTVNHSILLSRLAQCADSHCSGSNHT